MKKISDLFNAGGIELYFIKGIALSALLYNNSEARSSRDIDIFINDNDMDIIKADKLLRNNGYFRFVPVCEADSMLFKIYRKNYKHFKYKCQESAHLLEMHWKLHNYDTLYPNIIKDISGNYILVNIDGINIKTLLPEDYVLYLSIHGARHNWGQLYWLLDLAVIIDNWKINWKDIYSKANRHNMLRSVSSGLILTNRLFGSSIPENFTNSYIKNNNATRLIVNNSLKVICSGYLGMGKIRHFYLSFKSFLFIKPGLRHKLNIFLSLLTSYHDWEVLPLPEKLFFLYYFLRPFLWFYRHYLKK
ncbi:MAG: nucleotidyltransferase family protein [Bacteroidia bacterium]|nr:nucleotidyltransferase family protein [Bacteroidia bacterium]